jgi:hypothetical protein
MSAGRHTVPVMVFWQLTIDANDPARLARFWAQALGYQPVPPREPETTWQAHYHSRLGAKAAFDDRLFDPAGLRPPIWFQEVPETRPGRTGSTWTFTRPAATTHCRWSGGSRSSRPRSPSWSGWAPAWSDGPGTTIRRTRSTTS